jgi:hypothetical protein
MARRADPILTVHAVAIEKKWAHHHVMVKKAVVIGVRKDVATTTAHALTAEKVVDVVPKGRLLVIAPARTPTKVLDTCVVTDHPEVTARHEMATKAAGIDVQKVRRVAMDHHRATAPAVSTALAPTVHRTRQDPVRINPTRPARRTVMQIRTKATTSPKPPFDLSS